MIRKIMKAYKIHGGRMDQHFLIHAPTIERIVSAAELNRNDVVLEIGGGIGNLSEKIAPYVKSLFIIEKDPVLADVLKDRLLDQKDDKNSSNAIKPYNLESFCFKNVKIIEGDVLETDLSTIPFNKIVANLPYSISSEITVKILKQNFDTAVLMYQHEFAKRLAASPGGKEYGRLSVYTQYKRDAEILFKVPAEQFEPAPDVDSAVIRMKPKKENDVLVENESFYFKVTKAIFSQRRKKVKNSLIHHGQALGIPNIKERLNVLCPETETESLICPMIEKRAENLSPKDIALLSDFLYRYR